MPTTNKTVTAAQMSWMVKKGFAWADPFNDEATALSETWWTREGGYQWNVDLQAYEMVF